MTGFVVTKVTISSDELERIARDALGLTAPKFVPAGPVPIFQPRSEAVRLAIESVILATRQYDNDQFSPGAGSAAKALLAAGKRLAKAYADERRAKREQDAKKGEFHV